MRLANLGEAFERVERVGGYVGLGRVHGFGIRPMPPNPSGYDLCGLLDFSLFAWRQLTLVHVLSFLFVVLACAPSVAFADVGPRNVISGGWNEDNYVAYTMSEDHTQAVYNFFQVDAYKQLNQAQRDYLAGNADWQAFANAVLGDDDALQVQLFPYYTFDVKNYLYVVDVPGDVYAKANTILQQVMSGTVGTPGENESGISTTQLTGGMYLGPWTGIAVNANVKWLNNIAVTYEAPVACYLASGTYTGYNTYLAQRNYGLMLAYSNTLTYQYMLFSSDTPIKCEVEPNGTVKLGRKDTPSTQKYYNTYRLTITSDSDIYCIGDKGYFNSPDNGVTLQVSLSSTTKPNQSLGKTWTSEVAYGFAGKYTDGTEVTIPTTPDPTPQPPVQPIDPGTDVPTVDPPTWPTIDLPDIHIHGGDTTNVWQEPSATADYTELLRAIIARLERIGDLCATIINDMDTHCEHLQQAMMDASAYVVDNLHLGIDVDLDAIVEGLDTAWRQVTKTITDCTAWLADQMQWDFNYDLNLDEVTSLLRRILAKMGGGTSEPDPTLDPFSWGDWLNDIWVKLLTNLFAILPDNLGRLLELFDILKTKFPFSLPWDMLALLAIFDHAPVAPVIELPYPTITAQGVGYLTLTIDCNQWSSAMEYARPIYLIFECLFLATNTKKMADTIDPRRR